MVYIGKQEHRSLYLFVWLELRVAARVSAQTCFWVGARRSWWQQQQQQQAPFLWRTSGSEHSAADAARWVTDAFKPDCKTGFGILQILSNKGKCYLSLWAFTGNQLCFCVTIKAWGAALRNLPLNCGCKARLRHCSGDGGHVWGAKQRAVCCRDPSCSLRATSGDINGGVDAISL